METLRKYFKGDGIIWMVVLLLSLISLLAVYSSTGTLAYKYQHGNTFYYMLKHGIFLLLGLLIIYLVHQIPYKFFSRISQLFLVMAIPLLILTLVMGTSINSATRWLTLPGTGLTIQTSDIAKLALIMFLARQLAQKQDKINDLKQGFLPMIIPVTITCMLILPSDLSTAAMLMFTCVILMFVGRIRFTFLLGFGGVAIALLAIYILIALAGNTENRVTTWKNRIENFKSGDADDNYQVEQAKIAIATGGVTGKGPGKSTQRNFLPHPYSDFIFAIIIEEYGFIGALIILLLYLYLLYRAGVIVRQSKRKFPAFAAMGLTISIVLQAMINMAVAVNLLPVTGQTLPLVSMGGTSVVFTSISFGIILSASWGTKPTLKEDNNQQNEPDATEEL